MDGWGPSVKTKVAKSKFLGEKLLFHEKVAFLWIKVKKKLKPSDVKQKIPGTYGTVPTFTFNILDLQIIFKIF